MYDSIFATICSRLGGRRRRCTRRIIIPCRMILSRGRDSLVKRKHAPWWPVLYISRLCMPHLTCNRKEKPIFLFGGASVCNAEKRLHSAVFPIVINQTIGQVCEWQSLKLVTGHMDWPIFPIFRSLVYDSVHFCSVIFTSVSGSTRFL